MTRRLRPERFVTRNCETPPAESPKAVRKNFVWEKRLYNRDWGWAPDYVEAMWLMPATTHGRGPYHCDRGNPIRFKTLSSGAFAAVDLDWKQHVTRR